MDSPTTDLEVQANELAGFLAHKEHDHHSPDTGGLQAPAPADSASLPGSCPGCPLLLVWRRLQREMTPVAPLLAPGDVKAAAASEPASWPRLTPREEEVQELLTQGRSDREIAARLKVKPNTARSYVSDVLAKLGVHSRRDVHYT